MRSSAQRWKAFWLGCLLIAASACGLGPEDPKDAGEIRSLSGPRFILSEAMTPPSDTDEGWQAIEIPDRWSTSRPGVRGRGWYRFEFDAPYNPRDTSVYVPHFNMNLEIWLNGKFLTECGPFDGANVLCWNFPVQAVLPSGLLREEDNVLDLRLSVSDPEGELGSVYVGPRDVIAHLYASRFLYHVIFPQMFIAMTLTVILFMLAFWYSARDTMYLAFAGFVACLGIMMMNMALRELPISLQSWRWVSDRGAGFLGPFLIVCTHGLVEIRRPRVERAAFGWTVAAAVATLFLSEDLYDATLIPLYAVTLVLCSYAIWVLAHGLRTSRPIRYSVGAIGLVALGFGIHDVLSVMGRLGPDRLRLLPFSIPVAAGIIAVSLTRRFLITFSRARNLNVELEERVDEKHAELEGNFERMRDLEESRVVGAERERIMREMHDGVGGQLVSILAMVENGRAGPAEIASSLRLSIDDMRMVIDSLDPHVDDLNILLGVFRNRNEARLRTHGLRFRWEVIDLPLVTRFGRHEHLHILRILQEAVTNVIRHANATTIRVRTGMRDDDAGRAGIFLELTDDGIGIGPADEAGRGRVNMAQRARMIEAQLRIDATSEGTRLDLWIPLLSKTDETAKRGLSAGLADG
jgi:signal transduction histidine kinase